MNKKKKLKDMTVDELYFEKKMLDNSIPSFKNTQTIVITIFMQSFIIVGCLYAMKDSFSYILTGIIIWSIYFMVQRFMYRKNIIAEIKSRS